MGLVQAMAIPVFFWSSYSSVLQSSTSDRTIILVSGGVKFIHIFAGVTPSTGLKVKRPPVASENLTSNQP